MPWTPTAPARKLAVVICAYTPRTQHCLPLSFGEQVQILEENGEWLRGRILKKGSALGILPANHVHFKECVVVNSGQFETVTPKEDPVAREATEVIREWAQIMLTHFQDRKEDFFKKLKEVMGALISSRREILSGTLPSDHLKELKSRVTSKIDWGNRELGLDLIPRNEGGEVIDADNSSVMELFRVHQKTRQNISLAKIPVMHHLFFKHKTFACSIGEDADVFYTLYDADEDIFLSEPYLVRLTKNGFPFDQDMIENMACLFTDLTLTRKDPERGVEVAKDVYLVCTITRQGGMDIGRPAKVEPGKDGKRGFQFRRPVGGAVFSLKEFFGRPETDVEDEFSMPIYKCDEESFHELHRLVIHNNTSKFQVLDRAKGIHFSLQTLRGDVAQLRKENPLLFKRGTSIASKRGFPEIIMPGDVRNDLYVTICSAEFERGQKKAARNVEVAMSVHLDTGEQLRNCIYLGVGEPPVPEYTSVIYYHNNSPRWHETVKLQIPIDQFYRAHLKFYFKHCSSNSADKHDKIFCFAFKKLEEDGKSLGTTIKDGDYNLKVYKYDRRFDSDSGIPTYLRDTQGLQSSLKEHFTISTLTCSTKLTQNPSMFSLLKWRAHPEKLEETLKHLTFVNGEEIVKFLADIFDAVFSILDSNPEKYGQLVFEALVFIIGLLADKKFTNFRPVLDAYISKHFSGAMAHKSLVACLHQVVAAAGDPKAGTQARSAMKALEYIFKFIIQSRLLYNRAKPSSSTSDFKSSMNELFASFSRLMQIRDQAVLGTQTQCLQFFATIFPDLSKLFTMEELGTIAGSFLNAIVYPEDNNQKITEHKLFFVQQLVCGPLFSNPSGRRILLPVLLAILREQVRRKDCIQIAFEVVGDILSSLQCSANSNASAAAMAMVESPENYDDILQVVASLLRPLLHIARDVNRSHSAAGPLLACLLASLRLMSDRHYRDYVASFNSKLELATFVSDILSIFTELVTRQAFPKDWVVMAMLQNDVILSAVQSLSGTLQDSFLTGPDFAYDLWFKFFTLSVTYLTQSNLQLETFSDTKRDKILSRHDDKRVLTAPQISTMWNALGPHKMDFIPALIKPFLEMTLVPEVQVRKETIPICFDMIEVELRHRGTFQAVETEIIDKLDRLVAGGRGDTAYMDLFVRILTEKCQEHSGDFDPLQVEQIRNFIGSAHDLLERLLELRNVPPGAEHSDERAGCIYNLLEFYRVNGRREMFIRYVFKLSDIHENSNHFTEAALSLMPYATSILTWSDDSLEAFFEGDQQQPRFPAQTHRQRKELLYLQMIDNFDKGSTWENAIALCKELAVQYETELFDYGKLSDLHQRMATFFQKMICVRSEPQYFRVGYYGMGFPREFRNKEYVYRGWKHDHITVFTERIQGQFPTAQLLMKNVPPTEEMKSSQDMRIMICKVTPIPEAKPDRFKGRVVPKPLSDYYDMNLVERFFYVRPFRRGAKTDNEFETLWTERNELLCGQPLPGVLNRSRVIDVRMEELSPIMNAINSMVDKNSELQILIDQHAKNPNLNINPLTMALNGVIDAAVMGGTDKYREAFFNAPFLATDPAHRQSVDRLQQLMVEQITILEAGLLIHGRQCPPDLKPMHSKLEMQLNDMKVKNSVPNAAGATAVLPKGPVLSTNDSASALELPVAANSAGDTSPERDTLRRRSTESVRNRLSSLLPRSSGSGSALGPGDSKSTGSLQRTQTMSSRPPLGAQPQTPALLDQSIRRAQTVVTRRATSEPPTSMLTPGSSHNPFAETAGLSPMAPQPVSTPTISSTAFGDNDSTGRAANPVPPPRTKSVSLHTPNPFAMAATSRTTSMANRPGSAHGEKRSPPVPHKERSSSSLSSGALEEPPPLPAKENKSPALFSMPPHKLVPSSPQEDYVPASALLSLPEGDDEEKEVGAAPVPSVHLPTDVPPLPPKASKQSPSLPPSLPPRTSTITSSGSAMPPSRPRSAKPKFVLQTPDAADPTEPTTPDPSLSPSGSNGNLRSNPFAAVHAQHPVPPPRPQAPKPRV